MPDQPLLPKRASGAPRPQSAPVTDALTLDQVTEQYGLSESTVRRKLRGPTPEIAGAYKVPGPKGDEWRIPPGSLEALGYQRKPGAQEPAASPAPRAGEDVSQALGLVADALERLDGTQRQLMAAEEDRGRAEREARDALVEAAGMRERVRALEEDRERLQGELEVARRRRWFWQR